MAGVSDDETGRADERDAPEPVVRPDDDTAPLRGDGSEQPSHDEQPYDAPYGGGGQGPYDQAPYDQASYGQGSYGQGSYEQGWGGQGSYDQGSYQDYGQGSYQDYGQGWPQHTTAMPYQGAWYEPQQRGARVAGWVWPVMAATALVVGLIGGTMGGVLVTAISDDGVTTPGEVFDEDNTAAPPLKPENGSVAAVADALLPSTVQILTRGGSGRGGSGTGSGFVMDRRGHVITNNHVVSGVAESGHIQVIDHAGRRRAATIVGRSPVYDIAVLDVKGAERLQPAALGTSQSMNIGETVVALGSPLGLSSTVTSGIVSAIDRPVTTGDEAESSYINAVQTDAAINPGNSGGPLVNLRGEVIGVNSAIATVGGFGGGAGNIGVGFAIPMEQVKVTASQIVQTGEAKYPVIGANVNTGGRNGAEIVDVPAGTPADEAGLEEGDLVLAVEGKAVTDGIGLIVAIRSHQPGETISLTVRRAGEERTLRIRLDSKVG